MARLREHLQTERAVRTGVLVVICERRREQVSKMERKRSRATKRRFDGLEREPEEMAIDTHIAVHSYCRERIVRTLQRIKSRAKNGDSLFVTLPTARHMTHIRLSFSTNLDAFFPGSSLITYETKIRQRNEQQRSRGAGAYD